MKKRAKATVCILLITTLLLSAMTFTRAESDKREIYYNDDFIYEVLSNGTASIHYYIGTSSELTVPSYIDDMPVKSIETLAFYGTAVNNIIISEGITTLKDEAFFYSFGLESVYLPSTLEYVGQGVFRDCVNLKSVTFDESKGVLGKYMFYGSTRLESVTLSDSIENIPVGAFSYCQSLKEINLPKNLKDVYDYAFFGSGLESIELPKMLENIYARAFAESKSLAEISGADREFNFVADDAFYNCIAEFSAFKVDDTTATPAESSSAIPIETTQITSISTDSTEPSHFFPPPPIEPPSSTVEGVVPQVSMGVDTVPTSSGYNTLDTTAPVTSASITTDTTEPITTTDNPTCTTEPATEPQDIITDDGYFIGKADGFLLYEGMKISSAKDTATAKREELLSLAWNVRSLGDVNCDNKINIKDATQIQRFIALIIYESSQDFNYKNADVNTDGKITIRDATLIQKYIANIIDSLY